MTPEVGQFVAWHHSNRSGDGTVIAVNECRVTIRCEDGGVVNVHENSCLIEPTAAEIAAKCAEFLATRDRQTLRRQEGYRRAGVHEVRICELGVA